MAKVLKVFGQSGVDSYVGKGFMAQKGVYVSMDIFMPTAVWTFNNNYPGINSANLGNFLMFATTSDINTLSEIQGIDLEYVGTDRKFVVDTNNQAGGSWPVDTWFHFMMHLEHMYSGASATITQCFIAWRDDEQAFVKRISGVNADISGILFGWLSPAFPDATQNYIYIDNIKIGTQGWDSSDLFSEDFETNSLAAFDTLGDGTQTIITDPTSGVPGPANLGKVMKMDATNDYTAVHNNNIRKLPDQHFIEFDYLIESAALTNNDSFNWLGEILDLYRDNSDETDPGISGGFTPNPQSFWIEQGDLVNPDDWDLWWTNGSGDGALADGVTPDVWHTFVYERDKGAGSYTVTIDGVSNGPYTDDGNIADRDQIQQIGLWGGNTPGTDTIVYVRNIKIGTSLHASDIFADQIASWGDFRGFWKVDAGVSVVDDPVPPGPTDYTDADTAFVKLTESADEGLDDGKLIPIKFASSATFVETYDDLETELLKLSPITTFEHHGILTSDAGTERLALAVLTHECYVHSTPEYELDVFKKWLLLVDKQWEVVNLQKRWSVNVLAGALEIPC